MRGKEGCRRGGLGESAKVGDGKGVEDTRSGGKARMGAGEQERAGTRPAVVGDRHGSGGCGDGGHGREPPAEGTGSAAAADGAAE